MSYYISDGGDMSHVTRESMLRGHKSRTPRPFRVPRERMGFSYVTGKKEIRLRPSSSGASLTG